MTLFVCVKCCEEECQEAKGCTLDLPLTRTQFPIFCSPDEYGRIRVPVWQEVPKKQP